MHTAKNEDNAAPSRPHLQPVVLHAAGRGKAFRVSLVGTIIRQMYAHPWGLYVKLKASDVLKMDLQV